MAAMLTTLAVSLFGFVGILTVGMFLFQNALLYLPDRYPADSLVQRTRDAAVQPWPRATRDYRGLMAAPRSAEERGTVVVFHGNAGSALDRTPYVAALTPLGYRVLLAEYPGYGARDGELGEKSLVADAVTTAKALAQQYEGPLYVWGESLGCGVAAAVGAALSPAIAGLVLITPWKNLPELAQSIYWFMPAKWLVRDKFDNAANLRTFSRPVAVLMADADEIIPNSHTMALYEAIQSPKRLWVFRNAGHNSWPMAANEKWWREVTAFTREADAPRPIQ